LPSDPDLVPVGRVGRPHGVDGSFFVEGPSDRPERFANGATLYVGGEPEVVVSKRGSGGAGDRRPPG
jgi:ribosomal 30S subunit maturation factor RimM